MKKALRISAWILGLLLLLLVGAVVAIQSPAVQTALARKAAGKFADRIDGDIRVGHIAVRPFDAVVLEDIVITDRNPYSYGDLPAQDTLLRIGGLSARFSLKGLLHKERVSVSRVILDDAVFNLVLEQDSLQRNTTNLQRVFRLSGGDSGPIRFGDILEADRIQVRNFTFRMANPHRHTSLPPDVIDWNDLEINADILATGILVKDNFVTGEVEHLRLRDKTGLDLKEVSGKVKVGEGQILLDKLHLQDGDSDLYLPYLRLLGTLGEDYPDFLNRVRIEGELAAPSVLSMRTVSHFAPNLERFTFRSDVTGKVEGTVSSFAVKDIVIHELASGVRGKVNGTMQGLPDIVTTRMDFKVKDFQFGLGGLETFIQEWAPEVRMNLDRFAKGVDFRADATASGTLDQLSVKGDIRSTAGEADVDLVLGNILDQTKDISIGGTLRTRELHAGRIAGIDALGPVTLETRVDATLAPGDPQVRVNGLRVDKLQALGYDYSDINAFFVYSKQDINGRIACHDPNLDFISEGRITLSRNTEYELYLNLGLADLNALHIDNRRTISRVNHLDLYADFLKLSRPEDLAGRVTISHIVLEDDTGIHNISDIQSDVHINNTINRISFESEMAQGHYVAQGHSGWEKTPVAMVQDLKDLVVQKEMPALLEKPGKAWDGTTYEVKLTFLDTEELLGFLYPDLTIADNTSIQLTVDKDGRVEGNARSVFLSTGPDYKNYLKDLQLNVNNLDDVLRAGVTGSAIRLGNIEILNNRLEMVADNNHFGLAYSFDNQTDDASKASIQFNGEFSRDRDGLAITAQALPSEIHYRRNQWKLESQDIAFRSGDLHIDNFRLTNGLQHLLVHGGLSSTKSDTLSVQMKRFDISMLNSILMGGKMDLRGKATGEAQLISPSKSSPALLAGITCDSTYIAGRPMGRLRMDSKWNEEKKHFDFQLKNQLEEEPNLNVEGFLRPGDKGIGIDASLHRFDLGYAAPILEGIFHQFGGGLDGKVHVGGTLDKLVIGSEDLQIADGQLGIDFTRVVYNVSGPVSVDTEGLHFLNVSVSDGSDGKGTVNGSLLFGGFKDLRIDTHVRFNKMKVLGITDRNNPVFGNVYGSGRVDITGPFDELALNINARTEKDGDLHIPLSTGKTRASGDLLVFRQPYDEVEDDPYEKIMKTARSAKKKTQGDLDIRISVRATPDVTAHIDIGENSLQGSGTGNIDIHLQPSRNLFTIGGDYTLSQGSFRFSALNVVTREFSIRDGSSIRFNDNVLESDLNVTGVYSTKVDISTLLSSSLSDPESKLKQVDCVIHITEKLRNPEIEFDIELPSDLDAGTEGLIKSAFNTEDKKIKQFLYILIANSFLPNEESGIITTGSSNMLYSNMTGIMAGQLNSIFQKLDIPLDLGLNYQQDAAGTNLFDVALSTQLFNNRVVVNGTIGNRRLYGTTTEEVTGDLDIDIKLNKPGTFRLNLFSHSADQYTSFLDNSQRNGVGFAYQREFNTFQQFFHDLFSPRRDREDPAGREAPTAPRRQVLQIDSTGLAHPVPDHE